MISFVYSTPAWKKETNCMNAATLIATVIAAVAAAISAGATVVIARLTARTITAYNDQIKIGQAQVKTTQEQTFNQMRPVLLPPPIDVNADGLVKKNQDGRILVQWDQQLVIDGLQNIGTGPAFNIYGIFFGPPLQGTPPFQQRYVIWNYGFLPPGAPGSKITLSRGSSIKSETTIKGHVLYVPDDAEHTARLVRLTLTYHDIFGRKFASIYDYHLVLGWIYVGHFEDIEQDLHELDEQAPMTQQSNQMAYRMSKMQP